MAHALDESDQEGAIMSIDLAERVERLELGQSSRPPALRHADHEEAGPLRGGCRVSVCGESAVVKGRPAEERP